MYDYNQTAIHWHCVKYKSMDSLVSHAKPSVRLFSKMDVSIFQFKKNIWLIKVFCRFIMVCNGRKGHHYFRKKYQNVYISIHCIALVNYFHPEFCHLNKYTHTSTCLTCLCNISMFCVNIIWNLVLAVLVYHVYFSWFSEFNLSLKSICIGVFKTNPFDKDETLSCDFDTVDYVHCLTCAFICIV